LVVFVVIDGKEDFIDTHTGQAGGASGARPLFKYCIAFYKCAPLVISGPLLRNPGDRPVSTTRAKPLNCDESEKNKTATKLSRESHETHEFQNVF